MATAVTYKDNNLLGDLINLLHNADLLAALLFVLLVDALSGRQRKLGGMGGNEWTRAYQGVYPQKYGPIGFPQML